MTKHQPHRNRWAWAPLVLAALATTTLAQNVYTPRPGFRPGPYPNPYFPGYGYNPGPVGGALQGQAAVMNATGDLMIQQEQARIEREKANQAKLDTKKKSFEQMMWEKGNTPTLTENLKYESGLQLQRQMTSPTPAEITNGKTLNAMLPMIRDLSTHGVHGPPISINPNQLRQINVTIGKGGANIGMLKEPRLNWPISLQGPKQKKIDNLLPQATSQASMGALDAKTYRELQITVSDLNEELRKKFHKEEIDGGEFLEGKRFMESLSGSVTALRNPANQQMLSGQYAAKGSNVQEVADNMIKNGLSFAPSNPGSEAAYYAIHDAFVAYTTSAQAAGGFQVQYQPPRTAAFANK